MSSVEEDLIYKIAAASNAPLSVAEEERGPMVQVVVFQLNDELFCAPIQQVVEIIKPLPLTRMPRTPFYVAGILNLRGQVFPVIDLKKRLDLKLRDKTERTRIIKAEVGSEAVGFIVDEVKEVLSVPEDHIDIPPSMMENSTAVYLKGVIRDQTRMILWLDLEKLFGEDLAQTEGLSNG